MIFVPYLENSIPRFSATTPQSCLEGASYLYFTPLNESNIEDKELACYQLNKTNPLSHEEQIRYESHYFAYRYLFNEMQNRLKEKPNLWFFFTDKENLPNGHNALYKICIIELALDFYPNVELIFLADRKKNQEINEKYRKENKFFLPPEVRDELCADSFNNIDNCYLMKASLAKRLLANKLPWRISEVVNYLQPDQVERLTEPLFYED